jgi:signal transduction histidine kinase
MFINMLENAVKYTPPGGRIVVNLTSVNDCHLVSISDTGIGIPAEAQPHVFERFFRADKTKSRKDSLKDGIGAGAGLGLAIARSIAEVHGGSLVLRHRINKAVPFSPHFQQKQCSAGGRLHVGPTLDRGNHSHREP